MICTPRFGNSCVSKCGVKVELWVHWWRQESSSSSGSNCIRDRRRTALLITAVCCGQPVVGAVERSILPHHCCSSCACHGIVPQPRRDARMMRQQRTGAAVINERSALLPRALKQRSAEDLGKKFPDWKNSAGKADNQIFRISNRVNLTEIRIQISKVTGRKIQKMIEKLEISETRNLRFSRFIKKQHILLK